MKWYRVKRKKCPLCSSGELKLDREKEIVYCSNEKECGFFMAFVKYRKIVMA